MAGKSKKPDQNAESKRLPLKRERFVDNYLENGGNGKKAAEDAGFAAGHGAETEAWRLLRNADVQARIRERIKEAGLNPQEIIGILVSHMRGDLADILPEHKILKAAKDAGVSHLIKEIEVTEHELPCAEGEKPVIEVKTKIKIHDSQSAAKHLTSVFGLEKSPETHPNDRSRSIDEKRELLKEALNELGLIQSDTVN
jgi:phage terminase small subunit